jgi:hypothetical protein
VATAIGGTIARKSIAVVGNLLLVHSQLGLNPHGLNPHGQPAATTATTTARAVLLEQPAVRRQLDQLAAQLAANQDGMPFLVEETHKPVLSRLLLVLWPCLTAAAKWAVEHGWAAVKWELLLVLRSAEATSAAEHGCLAAAEVSAAECVVEAVVKAVVARHCQQHL